MLLPRLFDGVHLRPASPDSVDLVAYQRTHELPTREELVQLAPPGLTAIHEGEAPDDWRERRRALGGGGVAIGGRVWLRAPDDPPAGSGLLDVVIDRATAFGTGAHPTTRMCIELLLGLPHDEGFADLGCGAGALAIVAAKLGHAPVHAVDHSPVSVATASANAGRNGVGVDVRECDLVAELPPAAAVVAANVPPPVHAALASSLPEETRTLIASGITPPEREAVLAGYAAFELREELGEGGWLALLLERRDA